MRGRYCPGCSAKLFDTSPIRLSAESAIRCVQEAHFKQVLVHSQSCPGRTCTCPESFFGTLKIHRPESKCQSAGTAPCTPRDFGSKISPTIAERARILPMYTSSIRPCLYKPHVEVVQINPIGRSQGSLSTILLYAPAAYRLPRDTQPLLCRINCESIRGRQWHTKRQAVQKLNTTMGASRKTTWFCFTWS